jgi:hypothetical protein
MRVTTMTIKTTQIAHNIRRGMPKTKIGLLNSRITGAQPQMMGIRKRKKTSFSFPVLGRTNTKGFIFFSIPQPPLKDIENLSKFVDAFSMTQLYANFQKQVKGFCRFGKLRQLSKR